jgi:prepilin signal peptidase PulO-like enzyme (type II secretory pathway)
MALGLLFSILAGWIVGGAGNWLADNLPHLPQQRLRFERERDLPLLLHPWRIEPGASALRRWRIRLLPVGMSAIFALVWLRFGHDWALLLVAWFYSAWLLLVLVIDLEHRRVLNLMLPPVIAVALAASLVAWWEGANFPTVGSALLGGGAGFLTFVVIFYVGRGSMMGAGDVKLAGVIGLMVGYPLVWSALVTGILLGGVVAFAMIVRRGASRRYMPYGPNLVLGALFVLWLYWPA